MPPAQDVDESIRARARRDPEFREALLRKAARALRRGDTQAGNALAHLVSATNNELVEYLEDAHDLAIVAQRLADFSMSDAIPHAQIEAEIRNQEH